MFALGWPACSGIGAALAAARCLGHRRLLFEFADQQFELLDLVFELLGGTAESRAAQDGQLHLQLLDMQRLGMDLGGVGGDFDVLAGQFGLQVGGEARSACGSVGRGSCAKDMRRFIPRAPSVKFLQ